MAEHPRSLEQRLDDFGRAVGGSPDPMAGACPVEIGAPSAFLRAVAARRVALVAKVALGSAGVLGVLGLVVALSLRAPPVAEPASPPARHHEPETSLWNLRPGVQNPTDLDLVPGLREPAASGSPGDRPLPAHMRAWPDDLAP